MKKLTRRGFTAAGILAAISAGFTSLTGCDLDLVSCSPASLYGPPPFDPGSNEVVDVYGPPDVDPSEWGEDYDPDENVEEPLYGPPPEDEEAFEVVDNELVDVYGPPAMG